MYKPFKTKGKSPLMKKLVGKQHNLPEHLKAKIEAAPESPNKKYKSAMKKKGCAMCDYGKKKCTCGMASPKKYGKTTMKKRSCGKKY